MCSSSGKNLQDIHSISIPDTARAHHCLLRYNLSAPNCHKIEDRIYAVTSIIIFTAYQHSACQCGPSHARLMGRLLCWVLSTVKNTGGLYLLQCLNASCVDTDWEVNLLLILLCGLDTVLDFFFKLYQHAFPKLAKMNCWLFSDKTCIASQCLYTQPKCFLGTEISANTFSFYSFFLYLNVGESLLAVLED